MDAYEFSKWLNNEYIKQNPDKSWIKDVSSKSVKQSILNAEQAFKRFFKGQSKFPKLKKKGKNESSMYFVKNSETQFIDFERHRLKIPTLNWIRLKEFGYINKNEIIKSGCIKVIAEKYFVLVLTNGNIKQEQNNNNEGIGIDLGIKNFCIVSNGIVFKNINKSKRVKKIKKKLRSEQRKLSRKKFKKGGTANSKNRIKQIVKVQKLHLKLSNIRNNYLNKIVAELVKSKPEYITIENLNVKGMLRNRHLSKAIQEQGFNMFVNKLIYKCKINGIELRVVDRFFASSKICSVCGSIKFDLKLSDRVYKCDECGFEIDRDVNAALNLKTAQKYKIA